MLQCVLVLFTYLLSLVPRLGSSSVALSGLGVWMTLRLNAERCIIKWRLLMPGGRWRLMQESWFSLGPAAGSSWKDVFFIEMDNMLLRSMLVGGGSNGVSLCAVDGEIVHCICCAVAHEDGHLSWECTFPSLVHLQKSSEPASQCGLDRSTLGGKINTE